MTNSHIDNFVSAITSKITGLISSHNSNSSAHSSLFSAKQDTLVSGTSIKTINNQSILGSGNISITGGSGSSDCLTDFSYDSTNDELVLEYCSGKLIDNISKSTSGLVDTYTITYTDSTTYAFSVTNASGNGGSVTVDSALSSSSENPVQNKVIYSALSNKISTSNTVGLVKNDGSIDTSTYLTSHQSLNGYLQTSDVVDGLTSTSTTAPLSAKQGKVLDEKIGNIITIINGTGS